MDSAETVSRRKGPKWLFPVIFCGLEFVSIVLGNHFAHGLEPYTLRSHLGWKAAEFAQNVLQENEWRDVVVVDSSSVKRVSTNTPGYDAVSRNAMAELVEQIAKFEPRGIAVDYDFSMEFQDTNGNIVGLGESRVPEPRYTFDERHASTPREELDISFHSRIRSIGVPVFLGVHRRLDEPCSQWFNQQGGDWGCNVGATIALLPQTVIAVPREMSRGSTELHSFAGRISVLEKVAKPDEEYESHVQKIKVSSTLVDFGTLQKLPVIRSDDILFKRPDARISNVMRGKYVFIGVADPKFAEKADLYRVPGVKGLQPGVLIHAAATQTLLAWPVNPLSQKLALVLELVIFGTAAVILTMIEIRARDSKGYPWRAWGVLLSASILGGLAAYLWAARYGRVIWIGILVVLFIHVLFQVILASVHAWHHRGSHKSMPAE